MQVVPTNLKLSRLRTCSLALLLAPTWAPSMVRLCLTTLLLRLLSKSLKLLWRLRLLIALLLSTTAVSNLIDSAPGTLDTLNEIAAALNDDPALATTLTNLINANETHIDNNVATLGITKDDQDLGSFSGSTIADSSTVKAALQALETAAEAIDTKTVDGGDNVNTLVASTTADACPASFFFLAVDAATGAIKVIDKNFVEVE